MHGEELPLEPDRAIIDPHLHFWEVLPQPGSPMAPDRFLLHEVAETIAASGHKVTHTVFVECHQMYRADGPPEMACVGETEFANGIAAMAASGRYGPCLLGHRIVGTADLTLGAGVAAVLEAHVSAAGERFRGIRMATAWSAGGLFGYPSDPDLRGVMARPAFSEGARVLAGMDLSLDVWCLHTQLGELAALADAVPDLAIVLDHVGTPDPAVPDAFAAWAGGIGELARRPNVVVKLGGMGMRLDRPVGALRERAPSEALAELWRARVETCIEAFGPARCMFESNFPPDRDSAGYGATWNAFKIIAGAFSDAEKDALFRGTAARTYRIAI